VNQSPTFVRDTPKEDIDESMRVYDAWVMTVLTKGKSASGGGNEEGIPIQSAHACAMA